MRILYGCHVDYETMAHIAFQHSFVGFINILHFDDFNFGYDIVFAAEIEHFLRFCNASDYRTCNGFP